MYRVILYTWAIESGRTHLQRILQVRGLMPKTILIKDLFQSKLYIAWKRSGQCRSKTRLLVFSNVDQHYLHRQLNADLALPRIAIAYLVSNHTLDGSR